MCLPTSDGRKNISKNTALVFLRELDLLLVALNEGTAYRIEDIAEVELSAVDADDIQGSLYLRVQDNGNPVLVGIIIVELCISEHGVPLTRTSLDDGLHFCLFASSRSCYFRPIHRHKGSSETCVCIRGHFEEYFYDSGGQLTETVDMRPGGVVLIIEKGQWHSLRCLESGTILLEAKDGAYEPLSDVDILK